MYKILLTISFFLISNLAYAENKELKELSNVAEKQEAGKLVNTEEIFKKLTEKCDETDVLVLRARIRLELPRIDKNTASEVEKMMMNGLELCSEKKIDEAKKLLTSAYKKAQDAASIKFGQQGTGAIKGVKMSDTTKALTKDGSIDNEKKPWWKFW